MAIVEPDLLPGRYINELSEAGPEVTRAELWRREARTAAGPEARLGPDERLPPEPQRRAGAGLTPAPGRQIPRAQPGVRPSA